MEEDKVMGQMVDAGDEVVRATLKEALVSIEEVIPDLYEAWHNKNSEEFLVAMTQLEGAIRYVTSEGML